MAERQGAFFGDGASRLAGLAAQALGWHPADFWDATPADLALALQPASEDANGLSRNELNHMLESEHNG